MCERPSGPPDARRLSGPRERRRRLAAHPAVRAGRHKVYVETYSPWLNRFETDANSEFSLDFPMGGAFISDGSATAASGSTRLLAGHAWRQHRVRVADDGDQRDGRAGPGRLALHDRRRRAGQPAAHRAEPVGRRRRRTRRRDHAGRIGSGRGAAELHDRQRSGARLADGAPARTGPTIRPQTTMEPTASRSA